MWNDLTKMSAKDLKVVAEWMWLVKWEDFKTNASAKEMLVIIESFENKEAPLEDQFDEALTFIEKCENQEVLNWLTYENDVLIKAIENRTTLLEKAKETIKTESKKIVLTVKDKGTDNEYKVVTPIKRNGKLLKKWDNLEYFKWIESLIEDWIIEISK